MRLKLAKTIQKQTENQTTKLQHAQSVF